MSNPVFWQEFYNYGKAAGAKFPELVAAQAALESGWGEHLSGKNNYFGIKGSPGTVVTTKEWTGTRYITIKDEFKDFDSPLECVKHLVSQWYNDYRGYQGVNRAATRNEAAELLKVEGYATEPMYPELLSNLMNDNQVKEEHEYFLEKAATYYTAEAHQTAAWRELEHLLDGDVLEAFKRAYRGSKEEAPVEVAKSPIVDEVLEVPYFYQRDSRTGHGERMCFSSSMAMALDYMDPEAIDGDDDWYLGIVQYFGDTTSSTAQIKAARSLGYDASFHMDGRQQDLEKLLDDGVPVPIGVLHKGHVDHPTGGGHWVCLVGHNDTEFIVHDPFGDMDLVGGGYIKTGPTDGKFIRYSKKNLMKRWNIANDHDGWYVRIAFS
jgi:hypothetical protein